MAGGLLAYGEAKPISSRGLTLETCKKWDYTLTKRGGETVQCANFRNDAGEIVGQKARGKDKSFSVHGDVSGMLYGKHLWRAKGKRVYITEGEIDALTVSQVLHHKWQTVSLPNGAQGAAKAIKANLEWLNGFDQVVLCFDMDEPGKDATAECVRLFPPGKVSTVTLPLKDPNAMLTENRVEELVEALWGAKPYRPDGIRSVSDIRDLIFQEIPTDLTWFDPRLNAISYGRRYGECVGFGAGTGVGKTTYIMQQIAHDIREGHQVGVFAFEQSVEETAVAVCGMTAGKTFHIPDGSWTKDELLAAVDKLEADDKLLLYDHFGACEWDIVKERIRYLAHAKGVRVFYIDHLTALAAAEENERTGIDRITSEVAMLVKELKCWILFVSHLTTPDGTPHEEGGRVMTRHFRGSRSIGFWAHEIYGLERDQQGESSEDRLTTLRILKHRKVGRIVGKTFFLTYEESTGRLVASSGEGDCECPFDADEKDDF